MDDMLISQIVGQLVMMILTGVVGWLGGKLKGAKAEREQAKESSQKERDETRSMLRLLLYYRLHDQFEQYVVKKEPISGAEKHEIEVLYDYYHDTLGGNGEGTRMYKELMNLETQ